MNQRTKQILCFTALASAAQLYGANTTPTIVPRSQSFNAARQMVGWNNPEWGINRKPQDDFYSSLNLTFEYTRTFRSNRLAQCLFGNDLQPAIGNAYSDSSLNIIGSANATLTGGNPTLSQTRWLADYFGLPRDFISAVSFKPTISNYILDFSFYAGLDSLIEGLYFRIHSPFVHTQWNLNAKELVFTAGTTGYFQGYFSSAVVPAVNLNDSFLNYANGCIPKINNDWDLLSTDEAYCLDASTFNCTPLGEITWQPLCCSKIANGECGALSKNGFAELRFVLGYNFLNDENGDYHLGFGVYGAAPTGTRVGDEDCGGNYLFAPIVGNGHHWELGGQVTAHHMWWRNEEEDKSIGMYLEANVTHLFGACQTRCFDLCSAGNNSRYMLAERLGSNQASFPSLPPTRIGGAPIPPFAPTVDILGLEFANEYAPVANITRRNVISSIAAQGDIALSIAYQSGNFQWDLGYNFWGRSCEKLRIKDDTCCPTVGSWALKGDQRVYGFYRSTNTPPSANIAIKLPVTDSKATIHAGSNINNGVNYGGTLALTAPFPINFYADNSLTLNEFTLGDNINIYILPNAVLPPPTQIIYSSETPILIQEDDFNLNGTRGISNKIFTHLNWAMTDCKDGEYTPYIGVGAEIEFGKTASLDCTTNCDNSCQQTCPTLDDCCTNCSLSQWGIWLKIGASYN